MSANWVDLFSAIVLIYAVLNEPIYQLLIIALPISIILALFGLLSSHLMKRLIKRLHVLQKSVKQQVFYMFLITGLFSVLFTLGFNFISPSSRGASYFLELIKLRSSALKIFFFQGILFSGAFLIWNLIYFIFHYIQKVKKGEQLKFLHEKELLEFEAKALRAQMNPHFIFNSMNSIKSLINKNENDKAAIYLTTFSKLIRTLFQNSDKREVSLYEELETCKFYTQLERMRFWEKIEFLFDVDETIDLKDFKVPALILQPFIENAIWHGIMPRNNGGHISLDVVRKDSIVEIIVDDNGIGRDTSRQNKPVTNLTHQSKGVNLTQSRLELNNLLQQRQAKLETIDKKDENGKAPGTAVFIRLKEDLS